MCECTDGQQKATENQQSSVNPTPASQTEQTVQDAASEQAKMPEASALETTLDELLKQMLDANLNPSAVERCHPALKDVMEKAFGLGYRAARNLATENSTRVTDTTTFYVSVEDDEVMVEREVEINVDHGELEFYWDVDGAFYDFWHFDRF